MKEIAEDQSNMWHLENILGTLEREPAPHCQLIHDIGFVISLISEICSFELPLPKEKLLPLLSEALFEVSGGEQFPSVVLHSLRMECGDSLKQGIIKMTPHHYYHLPLSIFVVVYVIIYPVLSSSGSQEVSCL